MDSRFVTIAILLSLSILVQSDPTGAAQRRSPQFQIERECDVAACHFEVVSFKYAQDLTISVGSGSDSVSYYFSVETYDGKADKQYIITDNPKGFVEKSTGRRVEASFASALLDVYNLGTYVISSNLPIRNRVFTEANRFAVLTSLRNQLTNGTFTNPSNQPRSTPRSVQRSADEATRSWSSFWRSVVSAINSKNRAALKSNMPTEFFDGLEIVTPDEWFKFVDSRRLWRDLQKSFRAGTVTYPRQAVPTRLTRDRSLYFEFRNGRWYFAGVMGD